MNNNASNGGAIFYGYESELNNFPQFYKNLFEKNFANEKGGGVSLSLTAAKLVFDEIFQENSFKDNDAVYGPNYASYPVSMKMELFKNSKDRNLSENFDNYLKKLSIFSGIKLDYLINITLEDHFGQHVNLNFTE